MSRSTRSGRSVPTICCACAAVDATPTGLKPAMRFTKRQCRRATTGSSSTTSTRQSAIEGHLERRPLAVTLDVDAAHRRRHDLAYEREADALMAVLRGDAAIEDRSVSGQACARVRDGDLRSAVRV